MKESFEVRERAEEMERASLSTWASLASESKGRDRHEDPDPLRTAFQLDRDRLTDTDAFSRLGAKTHTFVPEAPGAGWRSRLSVTLATVKLSRTLARALRLNEDLTEAIASGHGLGAPPFGPAGYEVLGDVLGEPFEVAEQSLRVVERDSARLNLTWEVGDGIIHQFGGASTPEGNTAALGRRLATALSDLRCALRASLVHLDDVPPRVRTVLGTDHRHRVAVLLRETVSASIDQPDIRLGEEAEGALRDLEEFIDERVHRRDVARAEHDRALHCMRSLAVYADSTSDVRDESERVATIVDDLAAATDVEITQRFAAVFLPSTAAGE